MSDTPSYQLQVTAGVSALRRSPEDDAEMVSQALFGEVLGVLEEADGWVRVRARDDGYEGWVDTATVSGPVIETTHWITALRTYAFSKPDLKSAPHFMVCRNASLAIEGEENGFVRAARGGWIFQGHIEPLSYRAPDWVAVAESYLGTPYLWGGKESLGLDCSGLVQMALKAAHISAPRDSGPQEQALGEPVPVYDDLRGLKRGDLVFWKGHVGILTSPETLLHANAHHMAVEKEPLRQAVDRIARSAGTITAIKRL